MAQAGPEAAEAYAWVESEQESLAWANGLLEWKTGRLSTEHNNLKREVAPLWAHLQLSQAKV